MGLDHCVLSLFDGNIDSNLFFIFINFEISGKGTPILSPLIQKVVPIFSFISGLSNLAKTEYSPSASDS